MNTRTVASALVFCCAFFSAVADTKPIDLSGEWRFALDRRDAWAIQAPTSWRLESKIVLPGSVAAQGFGDKPSFKTQWTGSGWRYPNLFMEWQADDNFKMPFFLHPPLRYEGVAWFQRDVVVPKSWRGQSVSLFLERVHWKSRMWIDGREVGRSDALGSPHEYGLGSLDPGPHTLTLQIDNRYREIQVGDMAHSVTDHTQGNWNGVVGRIELRARPPIHLTDLRVEPSFANRSVTVKLTANRSGPVRAKVRVRYIGPLRDAMETEPVEATFTGQAGVAVVRLDHEPRPWNEFTPHRYAVDVEVEGPNGTQAKTSTFGFRDIGHVNGRLALNGTPIFLRGTLECCIFPLTGYPPTDGASWRRIVRICKDHGLNHIRFHSWCPPEAAFVAADEAGFYLQVEASCWAPNIGSGLPIDAWLDRETEGILKAFGNHPSFLLMAYGNEPGGANHPKFLQEYVRKWKAADSRRFWTTGSGWPILSGSDFHSSPDPRIQRWGEGLNSIVNAQPPGTDFDWNSFVERHSDAPVVSHEIGQWCVYPNFAEIAKYKGTLKARNFEVFREMARRNGLLPQARRFLMASGKLQTLMYKHDIEAALRTPRFGGFQLLDLHDFPGQGTALVGVLDAFWDSKGFVTAKEYARFCGPVVPLARLPKMVWTQAETLKADVLLSNFGPKNLPGFRAEWSLKDGDRVVAEGVLPPMNLAMGDLYPLGSIAVGLSKVPAPAKLKLTVGNKEEGIDNDWDVFVYPAGADTPTPQPGTLITEDPVKALQALKNGDRVLLMAHGKAGGDPKRPLTAGFSPIFWNTAWTDWQPPHTLGILVDPKHPALARFPTDFHTNWQWWELQVGARPFILTRFKELIPVVQLIDDWFTQRKLGYVFEARVGKGRLLACAFDLESNLADRPVARQMRASLLAYLNSDRFAPKTRLAPEDVASVLRQPTRVSGIPASISASGYQVGYEPDLAIDGDPQTMWHTPFGNHVDAPPYRLALTFATPVAIKGLLFTARQDGNPNGQFKDIDVFDQDGSLLAKATLPRDALKVRVTLARPATVAAITINIGTTHSGSFASLAELELETDLPVASSSGLEVLRKGLFGLLSEQPRTVRQERSP